jgi:hypothetical protein
MSMIVCVLEKGLTDVKIKRSKLYGIYRIGARLGVFTPASDSTET